MRGVVIMHHEIQSTVFYRIPKGLFNVLDPVDYARKRNVPQTYKCGCGTAGVKLYRKENASELHCVGCVHKALSGTDLEIHDIGKSADAITVAGITFVPAIPTEQNDAFWAHKHTPQAGVDWWSRLPVTT